MRSPAPALVLLALLAPPVQGHVEEYAVAQVFLGPLPEGAEETFDLTPPNGTVPAGMLLLANVIVYEGAASLDVTLAAENDTVAQWLVPAGAVTRSLAALTPRPGAYHLTLHNPGPGQVRAGFYFDAACDCPAKPMPVAVPGGLLVFPLDALPGSSWGAHVREPPAHRLAVRATPGPAVPTATWPGGFPVLDDSLQANASGVHEVRWTAPPQGRSYLVVQSVAQRTEGIDLSSDAALRASTLVEPVFERLPAAAPTPPLPAAVAAGALALAAAALRKR